MNVVIIIVSLMCGCLFVNNTYKIAKTYRENINLQTNYVQEYATIVEYKARRSNNGSYYYTTYYEYISPDNTEYIGVWDLHLYDEEEAKAQIGKKVPIYVDHELHLQADSPDHRPQIGGAYFCGVAAAICFAVTLISLIRILRWRKYKKAQAELQNK